MRRYLPLVILALALLCALLIGLYFGGAFNRPPALPQVGYIPPAPITAAPIVLSPTPTATERPTWTPTPTAISTFTPTATATSSSTPAVASISRTPTASMGPDENMKGDPPPTQPTTGAGLDAEVNILNGLLGLLITAIVGGALASALEQWRRFREWKPFDPNIKMLATLAITALVGGGLVWLQQYAIPQFWQFVPVEARTLLVCIAAFAMSQYWHENEKRAGIAKQTALDAALKT